MPFKLYSIPSYYTSMFCLLSHFSFDTTPSTCTQNAMLNDAENASICSWEAVEEQRGYAINSAGGGGGSSNGSTNLSGSVLWVPDHAVSQCTSCQTEFWLGRRKHHCRCVSII